MSKNIAIDYRNYQPDPDKNLVICPACSKVGKVQKQGRHGQGRCVVHTMRNAQYDGIKCIEQGDTCFELPVGSKLIVHPNV